MITEYLYNAERSFAENVEKMTELFVLNQKADIAQKAREKDKRIKNFKMEILKVAFEDMAKEGSWDAIVQLHNEDGRTSITRAKGDIILSNEDAVFNDKFVEHMNDEISKKEDKPYVNFQILSKEDDKVQLLVRIVLPNEK